MKKISILIAGQHQTSICLEEEFLQAFDDICQIQGKSRNSIITEIDKERGNKNLSSAIRVFVLNYYIGKHK